MFRKLYLTNLKKVLFFEKCQTEDRKFSVMAKEVLKASIDFLFEGRDNCHLTFFGGEPTLCKEHIAYGIQYANKM